MNALGYQSSAAPSDEEIELETLRAQLAALEESAKYTFMVERNDTPFYEQFWRPWCGPFPNNEEAQIKANADRTFWATSHPNSAFRVVRHGTWTLTEVMDS